MYCMCYAYGIRYTVLRSCTAVQYRRSKVTSVKTFTKNKQKRWLPPVKRRDLTSSAMMISKISSNLQIVRTLKKLIQYGLSIFKDYCSFIQVNYEELDNTELDKLLCRLVPGPKKEPTTRPSPCTASDLHCIDIL